MVRARGINLSKRKDIGRAIDIMNKWIDDGRPEATAHGAPRRTRLLEGNARALVLYREDRR